MIKMEVAIKEALFTDTVGSIKTMVQDQLEGKVQADISSLGDKEESAKVAIERQVEAETDSILRQIDALKRHVDREVNQDALREVMNESRITKLEYYVNDLTKFPYETRDRNIFLDNSCHSRSNP